MLHTYDSLRELALGAVVFPSLDAEGAVEVLTDALVEAGVCVTFDSEPLYTPMTDEFRKRMLKLRREWVVGWAMKAVYGASKVKASFGNEPRLEASPEKDEQHRRWVEERIALRRAGVRFHGTMKRAEINAALARAK